MSEQLTCLQGPSPWLGRHGVESRPVLRKLNTSRVSANHWPKLGGKVEGRWEEAPRKLSRSHQVLGAGSVDQGPPREGLCIDEAHPLPLCIFQGQGLE